MRNSQLSGEKLHRISNCSSREGSGDLRVSYLKKSSYSVKRLRRSMSKDPDQEERPFIYPCQAFKQFLLSMKDGSIDLKKLSQSPQLVDYIKYSQKAGPQKDFSFEKSLRNSRSNSANNRKFRPQNRSFERPQR